MSADPSSTPAAPIPVLANAGAGRRPGAPIEEIERAFSAAGLTADVREVDPVHLEAAVRDLVRRRAPVVGIAGGDGTLVAAAAALAGSETCLAPLPTGTLNHFARRLGIEELESAARAVAGGHPSSVPVGIVDDRVFLNTATLGLYADVVRWRERFRRWLGKWPAAAVGFTARILRLRQLDLIIEVDGKRLHRRTPLLWIGMGRGSFPLVYEASERRSSPDLEIVVFRPSGVAGVVRLIARLSRAIGTRTRPIDDPALEVLHARWVLVRAKHRGVGATLDGETLRLAPPIFIGVEDDGLRVRTPRRSRG